MANSLAAINDSMVNVHLLQSSSVVLKVTLATQKQVAAEVTSLVNRSMLAASAAASQSGR